MASSGMKPPMHNNQPGNSTVNYSRAFSNNSIENGNNYIYQASRADVMSTEGQDFHHYGGESVTDNLLLASDDQSQGN